MEPTVAPLTLEQVNAIDELASKIIFTGDGRKYAVSGDVMVLAHQIRELAQNTLRRIGKRYDQPSEH